MSSAAPAPPPVAAFRQKARKDRNVRKTTLSFDAEERLEEQAAGEAEQKSSPPSQSSSATHDDERKENEQAHKRQPVSSFTRPSHRGTFSGANEQEDDDGDVMQAVAEMRERRQKRQHQHQHEQRRRPASDLSSSTAARGHRPQQSVTISGGDFDVAEGEERRQQSEGGEYSAQRLAALRLNAIHVGSTHTPSPPPPHIETLSDDDDDDGTDAMSERQQRMVRAAKAQRARQRAVTELGEVYIPISSAGPRHNQTAVAAADDVIRIDDDSGGANEREAPAAARVGRTYLVAEDEDEAGHGTLMREEDEDDVVDMTMEAREVAGQDRLLFGDDGRQRRREKARQEMKDTLKETAREEVEVEDVDSEMEEWEQEQLRNGGVRVAEKQQAPPRSTTKARTAEPDALPITPQLSLDSLSLTSLQSSLQSSLSTLHHTNTATQSALASLATRLSSSRSSLTALSSSLDAMNERYQFYQQQLEWVSVWSGMMAEKMADIDDAWQEMSSMRRKRGEERQARTRQYKRDEREETGLVAQAAGEGAIQLDEFGRDLGYVREMDRERRDDIRAKVRALTRQRLLPGQHELECDDEQTVYDEVEGLAAVHDAAHASFLEDVSGILADVDDEWRSADRVATHFQHWQRRDAQSYADAYVGLALPKLLGPYLRIELMLSDTLERSPPHTAQGWLSNSSAIKPLVAQLQAPGGDADESALPQLLGDIVVPWLCDALRWSWNVRSRVSGLAAVSALADLASVMRSEGRYDAHWQRLFDAVFERLRAEVDEWQPLVTTVDGTLGEQQLRAIVRECVRGAQLLQTVTALYVALSRYAGQLVAGRLQLKFRELGKLQQSHLLADLRVARQQLSLRGGLVEGVESIETEIASGREVTSRCIALAKDFDALVTTTSGVNE